MINLTEYLTEAVDKTKKVSKVVLKKEASEWCSSHIYVKGRSKLVDNKDGTFTFEYKKPEGYTTIEININDVPDFVTFDIDCYSLILKGACDNALEYFKHLKVVNCEVEMSGSFGKPEGDINIRLMMFNNKPQIGDNCSLSKINIDSVCLKNGGDISFLKDINDIDVSVYMDKSSSCSVNFDKLSIGSLYIHAETHSKDTLTIRGDYKLKKLDTVWWAIVKGSIPSKVDIVGGDLLGTFVLGIDHIGTMMGGNPYGMDYSKREILKKILNGKLKVDKVKHFQHPYPEIPMDEWVNSLREDIAFRDGYEQGQTKWSRHTLEREKFYEWKDNTDYIVNPYSGNNENFTAYVILDKKGEMPVGLYCDRTGLYASTLCTNETEIINAVYK